jgi:hypothetical protein
MKKLNDWQLRILERHELLKREDRDLLTVHILRKLFLDYVISSYGQNQAPIGRFSQSDKYTAYLSYLEDLVKS